MKTKPEFDVWGEDPAWSRDEWKIDVETGDTNLGYWEWVDHRKESAEDGD